MSVLLSGLASDHSIPFDWILTEIFIPGLTSLTMLDLSYNSIISLGPASLFGLNR